ncbi:MAG: hypothetical protein H6607_09860 [Flavobacteriales bacterium]|nr:hypothetical protein [Flavobacteriales bacterium]
MDCTLRDGGYYNDWDFDLELAKEFIASLNTAGVDIVEVGYKSKVKKGFYGSFKYCPEEFLQFLNDYDRMEFAFMVDASEFITPDGLDHESLNSLIKKQEDSVFSWVRIASHLRDVQRSTQLIHYFKEKGYKVCFNLMGGSLLSDDDLVSSIKAINETKLDVFYIADSFGSFYPKDIKHLLRLIKAHFTGQIGIHLHDYANAIVAMEEEVDIIDGTLTGMGRGAGNLRLEQFLLGLKEHYGMTNLVPDALLEVMNEYFLPLKQTYSWGYTYSYMFSGANNIHQMYCQTLKTSNRFTPKQIYSILSNIPDDKRQSYKPQILDDAIHNCLEVTTAPENGEVTPIPLYPMEKSEEVVIIGGGKGSKNYNLFIEHFLSQKHRAVLECNDSGLLAENINRKIVILNKLKLDGYLAKNQKKQHRVITGEQFIENTKPHDNLFHQPYHLGQFELTGKDISIPDYDAGMYAVGLALRMGAKKIFLIGFDGLMDETRNANMDRFFKSVNKYYEQKNEDVQLISLTPTRYKNIIASNIFTYLNEQ